MPPPDARQRLRELLSQRNNTTLTRADAVPSSVIRQRLLERRQIRQPEEDEGSNGLFGTGIGPDWSPNLNPFPEILEAYDQYIRQPFLREAAIPFNRALPGFLQSPGLLRAERGEPAGFWTDLLVDPGILIGGGLGRVAGAVARATTTATAGTRAAGVARPAIAGLRGVEVADKALEAAYGFPFKTAGRAIRGTARAARIAPGGAARTATTTVGRPFETIPATQLTPELATVKDFDAVRAGFVAKGHSLRQAAGERVLGVPWIGDVMEPVLRRMGAVPALGDDVGAVQWYTENLANGMDAYRAAAQNRVSLDVAHAFDLDRAGYVTVQAAEAVRIPRGNVGSFAKGERATDVLVDLAPGQTGRIPFSDAVLLRSKFSWTPEQEAVFDTIKGYTGFANDFLKRFQVSDQTGRVIRGTRRKEIVTDFGDFFSRLVRTTPGDLERPGTVDLFRRGRQFKARGSLPRQFEFAEQGIKAGVRYEADPGAALGAYMAGTFREGLDDHVRALLQGLEVPDAVIARTIESAVGIPHPLPFPLDAIRGLNYAIRPFIAAVDQSGAMIQGGVSSFAHPDRWMSAFVRTNASMLNDDVMRRVWTEKADLIARATSSNRGLVLTVDHLPSEMAFQLPGALAKKIPQTGVAGKVFRAVGTPFRWGNMWFSRFGNLLRLELYERAEQMAALSAKSGKVIPDAEMQEWTHAINNLTGVGRRHFGVVGELGLFAPRFFRSQLELLGTALTNGTVAGDFAREAMMRWATLGMLTTYAINESLGQPTDFNPASSNFLRIRVGGRDISLFGTYDTLMRALTTAATEGPDAGAKFLVRAKASPVASQFYNLAVTHETFRGTPLKWDSPEAVGRTLLAVGQDLTPIALRDVASIATDSGVPADEKAIAAVSSWFGMKASPVTNFERYQIARNRAAQTAGFGDYAALVQAQGSAQARETVASDPAVAQFQAEFAQRNAEAAAQGNSDAAAFFGSTERIQEEALADERELEAAVLAGERSPQEFREAMQDVEMRRAAKLEELRTQFAPVVEGFRRNNSPVDEAVGAYFALFDQARGPGGTLEFARLSALQEQFRNSLRPGMWDKIQGALGLRERTALGQELAEARQALAPYFAFRDDAFTQIQAQTPALQAFASLDEAERYIKLTAQQVDPTGTRGVERRLRRRLGLARLDRVVSRVRRRIRRTNPSLAAQLERWYG